MNFYRKAKQVAKQIVKAFQDGNIAKPLATIYLSYRQPVPMHAWSIANQFACILSACTDARGYRQWQQAGRHVRKGEHARTHILVPLHRTIVRDNGLGEDEETTYLSGFTSAPVFDISQTDGEPIADTTSEQQFIEALPLKRVADAWDITITTFTGDPQLARGAYISIGNQHYINLGVDNANTFLHELVHAADDRNGTLTEHGQHWRSEAVAQFGASTLAHMIGRPDIADEGKTWDYLKSYLANDDNRTIKVCLDVLDRTSQCIDLIMQCAEAQKEANHA